MDEPEDLSAFARDLTRRQYERAAQLAQRVGDPYARRWSLIHDAIATVSVKASISREE